MSIGFPTNTVILIIAAMVGTGVGSWLILSQGLAKLRIAPHVKAIWRWGAAIVLSIWLLARLILALTQFSVVPPAVNIAFLVVALLVGIAALLLSPVLRQCIRAVPANWMVAIHTIRVGGYLFLALADMKLLPAEFAVPAGYGDMAVALLAFGIVYLLVRGKTYTRPLMIAWNLFGLLDFAVALTTGATYIAPFAAGLAASGVSLTYLNFVFIIPTFGVPLFALLHIYSLYRLLSEYAQKPAQASVFSREQESARL
jgi:hypothetical protein